MQVSFRDLIFRIFFFFFREDWREFLVDDPEKVRQVLYRCMRGRAGIKSFEAYLLVDMVNSERM